MFPFRGTLRSMARGARPRPFWLVRSKNVRRQDRSRNLAWRVRVARSLSWPQPRTKAPRLLSATSRITREMRYSGHLRVLATSTHLARVRCVQCYCFGLAAGAAQARLDARSSVKIQSCMNAAPSTPPARKVCRGTNSTTAVKSPGTRFHSRRLRASTRTVCCRAWRRSR